MRGELLDELLEDYNVLTWSFVTLSLSAPGLSPGLAGQEAEPHHRYTAACGSPVTNEVLLVVGDYIW
jgi:hypothetical protein